MSVNKKWSIQAHKRDNWQYMQPHHCSKQTTHKKRQRERKAFQERQTIVIVFKQQQLKKCSIAFCIHSRIIIFPLHELRRQKVGMKENKNAAEADWVEGKTDRSSNGRIVGRRMKVEVLVRWSKVRDKWNSKVLKVPVSSKSNYKKLKFCHSMFKCWPLIPFLIQFLISKVGFKYHSDFQFQMPWPQFKKRCHKFKCLSSSWHVSHVFKCRLHTSVLINDAFSLWRTFNFSTSLTIPPSHTSDVRHKGNQHRQIKSA